MEKNVLSPINFEQKQSLLVDKHSRSDNLQHMDIVTFIPKLPLSANNWAMEVSNTRQSEFMMADWTPSCMDRGVASQVSLRLGPFNSNLYAKFSACFLDPMSCTMAKNCWWPSNFSCFSSTNMKWWPKQLCIMTQSTAPGRLMSVARNTMSSPWRVVILLWTLMRCGMTCSREPCHLQEAPGQGHMYGRNSQVSSCSVLSVWSRVAEQPEEEYLQGNITVEATFSMARFLIFPKGPLHVGQQVSLGRQLAHTRWPLWHCRMGGST